MKHEPINIFNENRRLDESARKLIPAGWIGGGIALAISVVLMFLAEGGLERLLRSYLVSFSFYLSLALGALFFVTLQHLTRSGWSVVVRRIAEGMAGTVELFALLIIPILVGVRVLYEWARPDVVAEDALLQWKEPYLNVGFFFIRTVVYFIVWIVAARYFYRTSVRQDESGDVKLTLQMSRRSTGLMVLFALTVTFASIDWLMSLSPHWYSTIYGVYFFSGAVLGFFALLALFMAQLQKKGLLTHAITNEHYHDVGKLVFAFTVFWAYIAFSQYMLIWYANIPEETSWFLIRQEHGWQYVSFMLLFGAFVVPFLALMSRHPKRRRVTLVAACIWVLLMHYVDIYWLVMPGAEFAHDRVPVHLLDLTCFVGVGLIFLAEVVRRLSGVSLVPERDPRLPESLTFENV